MAGKNMIINAIQEGVKKAQMNYNEASSSILFTAPEYFMDVHIFQSIFRLTQADSLTLQHNNRDLLKNTSIRGRKIRELPEGSKIDIILWYSNKGKVRAFIEVKRFASVCKRDIRGICFMLKNDGRFGVLISGIYQQFGSAEPIKIQEAEKKLRNRLQQKGTEIKKLVSKYSGNGFTVELVPHEIMKIPLEPENNKYWIWRPVCFIIEAK